VVHATKRVVFYFFVGNLSDSIAKNQAGMLPIFILMGISF